MSDHFDALETRDPAERERAQFARLLANTRVSERVRVSLDLGGNDFGDLTNSWPPRVEREIHVLDPVTHS